MDSLWEKLDDDMKSEILNRVPVKLMVRFKLVSKDWNSLISCICIPRMSPPSPSSTFCGCIYPLVVRANSQKIVRFAGYNKYKRFSISDLAYIKKYSSKLQFELKPGDIQDCCNGIILVLRDGVYYVFNPSTFERIHIPFNPERETIPNPECFASFAFDPTKSLDFKIISSDGGRITNPQRFDVFSSETWKWSSEIASIDDELNGVEWGTRSVYFNGVVYRMLMAGKYLVCIDFGTKSEVLNVRKIELPTDDEIEDSGTIGTSRGCFYYSNNDGSRLKIWMLKDSVKWIPKVCVDNIFSHLDQGSRVFVSRIIGTDCLKVYAFHPNSDEIFLATPGIALRYHFGIKDLSIYHLMVAMKLIVGQSCFLPYSRCSILLNKSPRGTKFSATS